MHLLLLLLAVVLAAAGVAMVRYAVPIEDVAGAALFTSGVVAIVGASIIAALAAAVRSLGRIAERLEIQPLPLPPVAAVGREDPAPRPARSAPSAGAARPSLLGWLSRGSAPAPVRAARTPPSVPSASDPAAPPPVDLAPLTRIPETAPPPAPAGPPPPVRPQPGSAPVPNGAAATVYRSGVIDGMAYSLFMDGSIEAELPTGRVKFATIDELQQYLVSKK